MEKVKQAVGDLQIDEIAPLNKENLDARVAPPNILGEMCSSMTAVGEQFEKGEYIF